jgi:uncharacterized MAPEG superfamily protein
MTTELLMLALSVLLGFAHIFAAVIAATAQYGSKWNVGPRDAEMPPLESVAGRLKRASGNFQETFPLFAAVVLIADAVNRHGPLAVYGSELYLVGRVIYLPIYAAGIPVLRSCIWTLATLGIFMVFIALF